MILVCTYLLYPSSAGAKFFLPLRDHLDIVLRLKLVGWKWPRCLVADEPYRAPPYHGCVDLKRFVYGLLDIVKIWGIQVGFCKTCGFTNEYGVFPSR